MNTLENSCFQFQENDEASQECIRIMNERYNSNFIGKTNYFFWIANNTPDVFYKMVGGYNLIPATDYLALLTGKQLTEQDLIVGNRFECIETNPRHTIYQGEIWECIIEGSLSLKDRIIKIDISDFLNRHFKLLPTQESVKGEINSLQSLDDAIKLVSPFGTASISNPKVRQAIHDWNIKQTAHFQQELKEAKEKIEKLQFMIDNGLGNQDMLNDIYPVHRP